MTTWLEQVRDRARQKGLPDPVDTAHLYRPGRGRGYAQTALDAEVERVTTAQNGTRNHALNRAAYSLGQLVAGGELDRAVVERELTAAAQLVGLPTGEIGKTLRSGLDAGAQQPRGVPERNGHQSGTGGGQVLGSPEPAQETVGDWIRENLPALDWHALWAHDEPEEWIVEPLLPARRLVALYSAPKLGKSLLMLELAVAVARGTDVLGYTPDRPRRVLYVDFENDPRGDIRARLIDMGYGPDDLGGLDYLSFPQLSALDSDLGGQQLLAAVKHYGSEVVVIDTVSRAIAGEENENDTWLSFYRHTGKALKANQVALVRLDHTGKDETRGQRGGSAKSGDVDAVWRMSKVTETTFRLDCEANRMPVTEKTLVIHRETGPLRHRVDAEGRYAAYSAEVRATVELMDRLELTPQTGRDKARQALREHGWKGRNDVLTEALRVRKLTMNIYDDLSGTGGS